MNELQIYKNELPIETVRAQVNKIQELMKSIMQEGEHYGKIPGIEKNSLFKSGAEKICFTFRLNAKFEFSLTNLENGHREYMAICKLYSGDDFISQGVGICSTMESKYRYRNQYNAENTELPVPKQYWDFKNCGNMKDASKAIGGDLFTVKKTPDGWFIFKKGDAVKVENPDIADQYNTVIKMAEKRAYVDATIRGTAASDIFTQDVEDLIDDQPIQRNITQNNNKQQPDKQEDLPKEKKAITLKDVILSIEDEKKRDLFLTAYEAAVEKKDKALIAEIHQDVKKYISSIEKDHEAINDAIAKGNEKLDAALNNSNDLDSDADKGFNESSKEPGSDYKGII